MSDEVLAWLSICTRCIWSSWCHCNC